MATAENQLDVLLQAMEEVVEQPEDLEGCEKLIECSSLKNHFLRIGQALVTINDRQLYKRNGCTSFTQYVEQRADFGFGPRQALRLVAATRLVRNFPPNIALPTSERQIRALVGMDQQEAVKVWVKANLIATETGVPLTHRLVESVLGRDKGDKEGKEGKDKEGKERPATRGGSGGGSAGGDSVGGVSGGAGSRGEAGKVEAEEEADGEKEKAPSSGKKRPAPKSVGAPFQEFVSPDSDAFIAPAYIVAAVRQMYGGTIDLDPASTPASASVVQAQRTYAGPVEGLAPGSQWTGRIFIHPPSGTFSASPYASSNPADPASDSPAARYLVRAVLEVAAAPAATEAVLLLRAAVGQPWFGPVLTLPHCWLSERGPPRKTAAPFGSCVDSTKSPRGMVAVYVGRRVREFCTAFSELGHIPGHNSWTAGAGAGGKAR